MLKSYEESFTLRVADCDMSGRWRPGAILTAMQEAAGAHSALLGCGRDELLRNHTVWVLSRCELQMNRYPSCGEKVTLQTFPMPIRMYFFPRYYIFTDEHGEVIGKAGTLWLLLDTASRRMLPPGEIGKLIPDNRDLTVPMNLPATVGQLQGQELVTAYTPVYTDLDLNGHVNNTRYVDWLCNHLGIDVMTEFEPESVLINYNREILPGQQLLLRRILRDQEYRFIGILNEKPAFEIGGRLRKRK